MRVPRLPAALVAVLTVLLVPVLVAGPAAAGGPTSVLLTAPDIGRTASLYTTDDAYGQLAEQVGAYLALGSDAGSEGGSSSRSHAIGSGVTLTWLMHDVSVWRVDRVYVDAAGGPWISSQESVGGSIWEAPETWHRAAQPKALVALLSSMGLLAGTSGAAPGEPTVPVTAATSQPDTTGQGTTGQDTTGQNTTGQDGVGTGNGAPDRAADGFSPVRAGLLGLLVGALLTGLVAVAALRRSEAWHRWPDDAPPPADDDLLVSEAAGRASGR